MISTPSEPPRSFIDQVGDTAKDLAGGLKEGLASVVESLKDTGTAIVKNPIGTLGDMAYNATVGTVEDVIGFAAWGKDIVMDEGEREAFLNEIQVKADESGKANFVGEQAGVMLGSFLVSRLGIKGGPNNKPDTGGDVGNSKISPVGTGQGGIKITEPSLSNGGKPKGNYTKGDSHGVKKENETADIFADQGYDIEMLDEVNGGNGRGIKNSSKPDFLIEGKVFDCYSPTIDTNVDNIIRNIRTKTKTQAERIVLNLDGFTSEKITDITEGITRKANPNGDLKNLQELLIVVEGKITRIFGG